jgi:hypothetical protein
MYLSPFTPRAAAATILGLAAALGLLGASAARSQEAGNLLRNGKFQDDWLTLLPELKNHNWNYSMESYNRRDYIPDTWDPRGSWRWLNADGPWGQRRFVLTGPDARLSQTVNWCAVHDQRPPYVGFPDAGGYPRQVALTSKRPEDLVRDLTLRLRVKGTAVPANAGGMTLAWAPAMKPLEGMMAWPAGTYDWRWIEVRLPAAAWLNSVKGRADAPLPETVQVTLQYTGPGGELELGEARLSAAAPAAPNLLPDGGFEELGKNGYPRGWSRPTKYRYFPPGYYYNFNTWHNAAFDNRGIVRANELLVAGGKQSLQMIVPPGDEVAVTSDPIVLKQKEPRLLEASAWVKTDRLCMMQLDALDENGRRLDAFNFIHKVPQAIGTDGWRLVRQVFRPQAPLQSVRLQLCARGVNGYTLGGVAPQPQANVVGTIWWDNITLREPESAAAELAGRGVKTFPEPAAAPTGIHLADWDPGDRLLGDNVLRAEVVNPGPARTFSLRLMFQKGPGDPFIERSKPVAVPAGGRAVLTVPYKVPEACDGYTEYGGTVTLWDDDHKDQALIDSPFWFGAGTAPLTIALGAAYLPPEQKQFVRLNLLLAQGTLGQAITVRLDVIRRATGAVLQTKELPATPAALLAQRSKIPSALRDDFCNLLLTDLDVSGLPVQPFNDPQRNWLIRASVRDTGGKTLATADSPPFCRLAHEPKQPPIQSVTIDAGNLLYVNGQPWIPWGQCYGHNPVYDGPADPGTGNYQDLKRGFAWNLYDRHGGVLTRAARDFNCRRLLPANQDLKQLDELWQKDNLYASSAFYSSGFSLADYFKNGGGQAKTNAWLAAARTAPMIVSIAPGIEEAFGYFVPATPAQLAGLKEICDHIRRATGKPVMVGHGGYWNRFEFEKVPFFDIFDPETEPLYPAPVHTDLMPLIKGQAKVAWLRPQMYEPVPYERWRYHTWVELMRGVRGWQMAHGPADPSLFRGLHGEIEHIKPAVYSKDPGPAVSIEPWIEHWSRRHAGKTYLIAATTHGLTLGNWRWSDDKPGPGGRARGTGRPHAWRQEDNGYSLDHEPFQGPSVHSIQWLPDARAWKAGSKLVQWVRLDPKAPPKDLVLLAKADGRWTHAAAWGPFNLGALRTDLTRAHWFLRAMYRHASGFLGWDDKLTAKALEYLPATALDAGPLPGLGEWVRLELALEKIGAADKLLDGVGFLHEGGRIEWGRTSLVGPDDVEHVVWGDTIGPAPEKLAKATIRVAGLKAGTKVRVLFEDRAIAAGDGSFTDDFRGQDLYQRHGGGPYTGYGDTPVALHIYEIAGP